MISKKDLVKYIDRIWPERKIPDEYFNGYRRLAFPGDTIIEGRCWCCKHSVAHVTWFCQASECVWEKCYSRDEINWRDYKAGLARTSYGMDKWLGVPSEFKNKEGKIDQTNSNK